MPNAEHETPGVRFVDPAVRRAREPDVPALIGLFRRSYGTSYPYPELADPEWLRRSIHGEEYVWIVIEEAGELIACGALRLDVRNPGDRLGEMGRTVVHPDHASRGVGRRVVAALHQAAEGVVEFAYGDARTRHRFLQALVEGAGDHPLGFLPQRFVVCGRHESMVVYGNLTGPGRRGRRPSPPRLVPALVPLAAHVLASMRLPCAETVDAAPYARREGEWIPEPLAREAAAALHGTAALHAGEPAVFGPLARGRGADALAPSSAAHTVCRDANGRLAGALGLRFDAATGLLHVVDLVAESDGAWRELCEQAVRAAARVDAASVELDVSAYAPRLQATLVELGFVPVVYQPGMIVHGGERLDVVRMMRRRLPLHAEALDLTSAAAAVHALVAVNLPVAP